MGMKIPGSVERHILLIGMKHGYCETGKSGSLFFFHLLIFTCERKSTFSFIYILHPPFSHIPLQSLLSFYKQSYPSLFVSKNSKMQLPEKMDARKIPTLGLFRICLTAKGMT